MLKKCEKEVQFMMKVIRIALAVSIAASTLVIASPVVVSPMGGTKCCGI